MFSGRLEGRKVTISKHALTRMVEMEMTPEEVRGIICHPEEIYGSQSRPGSGYLKRGKYAIAVKLDPGEIVVITCLYSSDAEWKKAAAEGNLTDDRLAKLLQQSPRK